MTETVPCAAVHPLDVPLPDPIPEEWGAYRRVCYLPIGHLVDPTREDRRHESPQGDRWEDTAPLPAPFTDWAGRLDVDAMRKLAPELRTALVTQIQYGAQIARHARGTVVVPEDTFPLVRQVVAGAEVLRQWRDAFEAAARECDAIAEEEALTALGPYPGVEEAPAGSLFVPDGAGQRIAVRPDWKPGESTFDVATLVEWLIDEEVAEVKGERRQEAREAYESRQAAADPNGEGIEPEPLDPIARAAQAAWFESDARHIAGQVVARLLSLGRYTPGAKALDELRKRLASQQRDSDAAVIRQVRSVGPRRYAGVRVTREET